MAIVYRIGNGTPLSYTQVDENFRWLTSNMSSSIVALTGSVQIDGSASGSFSGSFVGNGSGLTGISVGSITGVVKTTEGDSASQIVEGSLVLTGDLTAEQYIISSSVVYYTESFASGSHVFGDSLDDTHQFTGSILVTGSVDIVGPLSQGSGSIATGISAFSQGTDTLALNTDSHAEGVGSIASGLYSHAEGYYSLANNSAAHAEGQYTTASAFAAHAEGNKTSAVAGYGHSEGDSTKAHYAAHSEGYNTTASGNFSHAEGSGSSASGRSSHAEGNNTVSVGIYSHAQGNNTYASSTASFSSGYQTSASHDYSFAHGYKVSSPTGSSVAFGVWDDNDTLDGWHSTYDKIFHIGGGTNNSDRTDAFRVGWKNSASLHLPVIQLPSFTSDGGGMHTASFSNPSIGMMFVSASDTAATTSLVVYLGSTFGWRKVDTSAI